MLKTQIFANKVSNLTDARYFAAWGADWLCFSLDQNAEEFISPMEVNAIKEWVSGPKLVGEFGILETAEVQKGIMMLGLDGILLGNFATAETADSFSDIERIKLVVVGADSKEEEILSLFENWRNKVSFFLLDLNRNAYTWENLKKGAGPISTDFIKLLCDKFPVLLSVDCKGQDVEELMNHSIKGLVLNGGAEEKVGMKSFEEIDEILEALEED